MPNTRLLAIAMNNIEEGMLRIYNVTGTETQAELGAVLGVSQASVSDAKNREARFLLIGS